MSSSPTNASDGEPTHRNRTPLIIVAAVTAVIAAVLCLGGLLAVVEERANPQRSPRPTPSPTPSLGGPSTPASGPSGSGGAGGGPLALPPAGSYP